jgi:hypothetical protein
VPACAIGSQPVEADDDMESEELTCEVNMLFDYLGLEAVAAARE